MKAILLSLMIAMSAALPAAAENWVDLNEGGRQLVGIDTDSILTDNNGNYNFWIMHKDGQIIRQVNATISCEERTIVLLARKRFNLNGELIQAFSPKNPIVTNIKLDSNGATYYRYLCN
ncbi:hypothetical protein H6G96_38425 [Nostoc sp. FACHB-892]|uniref:hypothetical protein n=1 Tax=Nostoc sp. FACHB-892 TaxID=2692843 RepID=UPI0016884A7A|nr:hypothetical protein [Nostoc sp. FACHB-892]MBD2731983.1 hypothetical protein [Nostoc sp. FACHB-892]